MKSIRKRVAIVLGGILIPIITTFGAFYLFYTEERINNLAKSIEQKIPGRVELILKQTVNELYAGAMVRKVYLESLLINNVEVFEDVLKTNLESPENILSFLKGYFQGSMPDSFYSNVEISVIESNGIVVFSTRREFLNLDLKRFGTLWDSVGKLNRKETYFVPVSFSSRDAKIRSYLYTRVDTNYFVTLSLDVDPVVYSGNLEKLKRLSVFIKEVGIYNVAKRPLMEYFQPFPEKIFKRHPFYRDIEENIEFHVGTTKLKALLFVRLDFYSLFSVFLFNLLVYVILIAVLSVVALYFEKLVTEETQTLTKIIEMVRHLEDPKKVGVKIHTQETLDLLEVLRLYVLRANQKIAENEILLKKFKEAFYNFSEKLAVLAERFDPEDAGHLRRVKYLTKLILENIEVDEDYKNSIVEFSILHDIGKIFVPHSLLIRNGPLSEEEKAVVRRHTIDAEKLLSHPELRIAREIAVYHHENYDGTGYPFGLKGEEIPFPARVVKVVNTYDVLRSERPYKKALSHEEALRIMLIGDEKTKPTHFDPKILSVFIKICSQGDPYERMEKI